MSPAANKPSTAEGSGWTPMAMDASAIDRRIQQCIRNLLSVGSISIPRSIRLFLYEGGSPGRSMPRGARTICPRIGGRMLNRDYILRTSAIAVVAKAL